MSIIKYLKAIAKALEDMPPNATISYFVSTIITHIIKAYKENSNAADSTNTNSIKDRIKKTVMVAYHVWIELKEPILFILALLPYIS